MSSVCLCFCFFSLVSKKKKSSFTEAVTLELRSEQGHQQYECWSIYCSCSLKSRRVTHSRTLLQALWAIVQQSCRPASWQSQRGEDSATVPENRRGIIPPSFHPLTHCGTISVSKMSHPAPRHLSHSVPRTLCSAQASLQRQQGEEPPERHAVLNCHGGRSRKYICT